MSCSPAKEKKKKMLIPSECQRKKW